MDNLLIYSLKKEENLSNLEEVFYRWNLEELFASQKKFYFMQGDTECLGVMVSRKGICVNLDNIEVVRQ